MADTIEDLLPSWLRHLRAANRSPNTMEMYKASVLSLARHLGSVPAESVTKRHIEEYLDVQLTTNSPGTAAVRCRCLRQFWRWAAAEGDVTANPMGRVRAPRVPMKSIPVIPDASLRRLLDACSGKSFTALRNTAIIRVLLDTGMRRGELVGIKVAELDLDIGCVKVMGKGSKPRLVPLSPKTVQALDRYLRARQRHRHCGLPDLWLAPQGHLHPMSVNAMLAAVCRRARVAPIHPHQFRHTAAHAWLAGGGTEGDAMKLFGWSSGAMLTRYGASAAEERAIASFHRRSPGDRV